MKKVYILQINFKYFLSAYLLKDILQYHLIFSIFNNRGLEQFIKYRQSENEKQKSPTDEKYSQKISVVQTLLEDYKNQIKDKSISEQLLPQPRRDSIKEPLHRYITRNIITTIIYYFN